MKKNIITALILGAIGVIVLGILAFNMCDNNKSNSENKTVTSTNTEQFNNEQAVSKSTQINKTVDNSKNSSSVAEIKNTNSESKSSVTNNNNISSVSVVKNTDSEKISNIDKNNTAIDNANTDNNTKKNNSNSQNKVPLIYGDGIPGTHRICHNVIEIHGQILPKKTSEFEYMLKETNSPITEGKVTISANTPYTEYSGYSNFYKYYIIKPFKLVNEGYKTTETLNKAYPDKTIFNENENNLTAIGYMQGGIIVSVNEAGKIVYVDANSIHKNITFERGNIQYFCANAITIEDNIPARGEPAELPTYDTIGTIITQKGLNVVADAEVNGFTRIIFGTSNGIFQDWVPSTSIKIENYN